MSPLILWRGAGQYRRGGKSASGHGHHTSEDTEGVLTVYECSDKELREVEWAGVGGIHLTQASIKVGIFLELEFQVVSFYSCILRP